MGQRAYLMVTVEDAISHTDLVKALRELENTPGVDFVDRVIGSRDVVVMVEAPVSVEAIATKIRHSFWVKDLEIMRIVNLYERHNGSKMRLLKSLVHSGT